MRETTGPVPHGVTTCEPTKSSTTAALWFGLLAGPLASLVTLQIDYMAVPHACGGSTAASVLLHATPAVLLLVTVVAGIVAWRYWHGDASDGEEGAGTIDGRNHFMGVIGVFSSALFSLVIIAQWIASFIVHPCYRI